MLRLRYDGITDHYIILKYKNFNNLTLEKKFFSGQKLFFINFYTHIKILIIKKNFLSVG